MRDLPKALGLAFNKCNFCWFALVSVLLLLVGPATCSDTDPRPYQVLEDVEPGNVPVESSRFTMLDGTSLGGAGEVQASDGQLDVALVEEPILVADYCVGHAPIQGGQTGSGMAHLNANPPHAASDEATVAGAGDYPRMREDITCQNCDEAASASQPQPHSRGSGQLAQSTISPAPVPSEPHAPVSETPAASQQTPASPIPTPQTPTPVSSPAIAIASPPPPTLPPMPPTLTPTLTSTPTSPPPTSTPRVPPAPLPTPPSTPPAASNGLGSAESQERPKHVPTVLPTPDDFERDSETLQDMAVAVLVSSNEHGAADIQGAEAGALLPSQVVPVVVDGSSSTAAIQEETADEDEGRRINLAASADGATIVAANKEARKPEKTIDDDDDSFMKNTCSANKWMIIELSQLGRVDEVTLVNKEMYSSRVREFVVKGRQSHPRKDGFADYWRGLDGDAWQVMGVFVAANKKGSQTFKMSVRRRVRYLLLQFLSHYGSEEVCALNSVSVLGVSAAQELEEALARHLHPDPAVVPEFVEAPLVVPPAPTLMPPLPQPPAAARQGPAPAVASPVAAQASKQTPPPAQQSSGTGASGPDGPDNSEGAVVRARQHPAAAELHASVPVAGDASEATQQETDADASRAEPCGEADTELGCAGSIAADDADDTGKNFNARPPSPPHSVGQRHPAVHGNTQMPLDKSQPAYDASKPPHLPLSDQEPMPGNSSIAGDAASQQPGTPHRQPDSALPQMPAADGERDEQAAFHGQPVPDGHEDKAAGAQEDAQGQLQGDHMVRSEAQGKDSGEAGKQVADSVCESQEEAATVAGAIAAMQSGCGGHILQEQPTDEGALQQTEAATAAEEASNKDGLTGPAHAGSQAAGSSNTPYPGRIDSEEPPSPVTEVEAADAGEVEQSRPASGTWQAGLDQPPRQAAAGPAESQTQAGLTAGAAASTPTSNTATTTPAAVASIAPTAEVGGKVEAAGGGVPSSGGPLFEAVPGAVLPDLPTAATATALDTLLAAMEGGPAAKPKQAGNLFDLFKQEFVIMRLNQTRTWRYIVSLVDVLNRNAAGAHDEFVRLETQMGELRAALDGLPQQVEAAVLSKVPESNQDQVAQLAAAVAQLQAEVRQGRMREHALLLYSGALVGALLSNMCVRSRLFHHLLMALSIVNGLLGLALQSPEAQRWLVELAHHVHVWAFVRA